MSVVHCGGCDNNIDTVFAAEHFIEDTETCDQLEAFKEKFAIEIHIQIDAGDGRILDTSEVGDGRDIEGVINEAIATLGKAERRYIPTALNNEYEESIEDEE